MIIIYIYYIMLYIKNSPVTGLEWPRGFQEVKVPRLHDNNVIYYINYYIIIIYYIAYIM